MRNFGHQTRSVGAHVVKEKRICRFCNTVNGGTNPFGSVVTFRKRSHAYSEALGNKHMISKDECDACNQRFSVGCELSLINLLSPFRSIHGLKGKHEKKSLWGIRPTNPSFRTRLVSYNSADRGHECSYG